MLESQDDCIVVFASNPKYTVQKEPNDKTPTSERGIIYGPTVHFMSPNENMHQFEWSCHASILDYPSEGMNRFHALSTSKISVWRVTCPLKMADSSTAKVTLAISYKIDSVEKCVAAQNPIQLLEPALLHDVQRCAGEEATIHEWIAQESTFPTFRETLTSVGFRLFRMQVLKVESSVNVKQKVSAAKRDLESKDLSLMQQQDENASQINEIKLDYLRSLNDMGVDVMIALCDTSGRTGFPGAKGVNAET